MITKQELLDRKDAYQRDIQAVEQKANATIIALKGAIQDCDYWIAKLEAATSESE